MKRPACIVGCSLLLFLWLIFYLKPPEPFSDDSVSGMSVAISGIIDDKYHKNSSDYLIVSKAGTVSGIESEKKYKVIVKLKKQMESLGDHPAIGSRLIVSGKGMIFARARNPGNFDLAEYEMIRGVDFEIYDAEIVSFGKGSKTRFIDEGLCLIRERLSRTINELYGDEDAGIINAMLLGDRTGLSEEIRDRYRMSGMSHILCISALHITLLGMGFLKVVRKAGLGRISAYSMTFIMMIIYGRLTGSGVSTVRALITFALMMIADIAGRTPDLLSSMAVAGSGILIFKPLYAMDAGFILSFTAVCGIGLLNPVFKRLFLSKGTIADSIRTSISVTFFMLPVTLYFFYSVPVWSVLINLVVIPLLGVLLVSSVVSVTAGCLIMTLGRIIGFPARLILLFYRGITRLNELLPFSLITAGRPEIWQIVLYYFIVAVCILWIEKGYDAGRLKKLLATCDKGKRGLWEIRLTVLIGACLAVFILFIRIRPELSLTMIDTGQGDCHLIELKGGKTVMIDCGSSDVKETAKYRVIPYVNCRGHDRIDYAIVTHTDEDHINGFIEMLSKDVGSIEIGTLIMPDITDRDEGYTRLVKMAEDKGVAVRVVGTGDIFKVGNISFKCLNPKRGAVFSDANESSVCVLLSLKDSDFKALYTGDTEGEGEASMIRELSGMDYGKRLGLLKCAHHGSRFSTPEELLCMIRPVYTFISAGVNNQYGHPHEELIERLEDAGSRTYVTNICGAVRMDVEGDRIRVERFIEN